MPQTPVSPRAQLIYQHSGGLVPDYHPGISILERVKVLPADNIYRNKNDLHQPANLNRAKNRTFQRT